MATLPYAMRDSATMLRRDITHALRYPIMTISSFSVPVLFLLLFAGVFGNALRGGLGPALNAGGSYIDYLTPGILLMTACSTAEVTAVSVSTDMAEGIITRFRTMAITRASVLTGQVAGGVIRSLISVVLVIGVAFGLGFRPAASPAGWFAAAGIFALLSLAVTWLTVSFGLLAKTPAGANSLSLLVVILPFVSSAFVPATSMPAGVRWFAQYQPFTPVINALRGLLTGTPTGHSVPLAIAWSAGIAAVGYLWARKLYNRDPAS